MGEQRVGSQSLWNALQRICSQKQLEFWESAGGALNIAATPLPATPWTSAASNLSDTYSLEEGSHCDISQYTQDSSALANVVQVVGPGDKYDAATYEAFDADSISKYGVVPTTINVSSENIARSYSKMQQLANDTLARRKTPRHEARVKVNSLPARAGEAHLGDVIRITSSRLGVDLTGRVITEGINVASGVRGASLEFTVESSPRAEG